MSIFEYTDYRAYLNNYLKQLPKKGRGELSRIAQHLRVNTTLLSQIRSGLRDFNIEQTYEMSIYLGHSELETEYFSILVQIEKSGTSNLKKYLEQKRMKLKNQALSLSERISHEKRLTDQDRTIFYSSWLYSAVHLFTSTNDKGLTLEEICSRFNVSRIKINEIIIFLLKSGLCNEHNGRFSIGVRSTFVERGSPHLLKHHSNWRLKAIAKSDAISNRELMYTGQVSISKKDFETVREKLTEFLKDTMSLVKDSPAQDIASLNIDWFWIDK